MPLTKHVGIFCLRKRQNDHGQSDHKQTDPKQTCGRQVLDLHCQRSHQLTQNFALQPTVILCSYCRRVEVAANGDSSFLLDRTNNGVCFITFLVHTELAAIKVENLSSYMLRRDLFRVL